MTTKREIIAGSTRISYLETEAADPAPKLPWRPWPARWRWDGGSAQAPASKPTRRQSQSHRGRGAEMEIVVLRPWRRNLRTAAWYAVAIYGGLMVLCGLGGAIGVLVGNLH
jgi:hypothetical protein